MGSFKLNSDRKKFNELQKEEGKDFNEINPYDESPVKTRHKVIKISDLKYANSDSKTKMNLYDLQKQRRVEQEGCYIMYVNLFF